MIEIDEEKAPLPTTHWGGTFALRLKYIDNKLHDNNNKNTDSERLLSLSLYYEFISSEMSRKSTLLNIICGQKANLMLFLWIICLVQGLGSHDWLTRRL